MAIQVGEKFNSPRLTTGRKSSAEGRWWITGTGDENAAKAALCAAAPASIGGAAEVTMTTPTGTVLLAVWPFLVSSDVTVEQIAPGIWDGIVTYSTWGEQQKKKDPPATGDAIFDFDTTGGTQHITQSICTVNSYGQNGDTPPNFNGAINVTRDSVDGCDITIPVYQWGETHYLPSETVTDAYKGILYNATGCVNVNPFKGTAALETLFLGASGSQRGNNDWEIRFKFASSPNKTDLNIPGISSAISKNGWEYLWVRYHDVFDNDDSKLMLKKPFAAYVERVYLATDFASLGIGT